jgi:hypothetical protein
LLRYKALTFHAAYSSKRYLTRESYLLTLL